MIEILGIDVSLRMLVYLMLAFSFFVGVILMVSKESFLALHSSLQKEYGVKRRLIPGLEDKNIEFVDRALVKYRVVAGLLIAVSAFFLLLTSKL